MAPPPPPQQGNKGGGNPTTHVHIRSTPRQKGFWGRLEDWLSRR